MSSNSKSVQRPIGAVKAGHSHSHNDSPVFHSHPGVEESGKNPAAVFLGRLGGLKGGKARAKSLTKKERSLAARRAALARWKGNREKK